MTKTILAVAALFFAASAHAADNRQQFISGNPDSDNSRHFYAGVAAMPPSVGRDLDRYQGIADGNPDLLGFHFGPSPRHMRPDIYGAFGASPDLSY